MRLKVAGLTDVGLRRENNQDSFLVDQDLGLFVVADGMGGHSGGEVASRLAVQGIHSTVKESFEKDKGINSHDLLQKAYSSASKNIYQKSIEEPGLKGMGT